MSMSFDNDKTEQDYHDFQHNRGRSSSMYALAILAVINFIFAFLEHWILGVKTSIPLYGYLVVGLISLGGVLFSWLNTSNQLLQVRVLVPGALTLLVLITAVSLQDYRIYHAAEMALLAIWIGSLNVLSLRLCAMVAMGALVVFSGSAYLFGGISGLKLQGLLALMLAALAMTLYVSYILERLRRMLFLSNSAFKDMSSRQENWAFALIDLDAALNGIRDFRALIMRMMENLQSVIEYDSYVLTALEGKGPKPEADEVDGELFANEDGTLWTEELLSKLSQTRQSAASTEYESSKGFLGRDKQSLSYFRLDIPVFNDSSLIGVISLRRRSEPFDDLDMTASVSITSQAMLIFNRTKQNSLQVSKGIQQAKQQAAKQAAKEVAKQAAKQAAVQSMPAVANAGAEQTVTTQTTQPMQPEEQVAGAVPASNSPDYVDDDMDITDYTHAKQANGGAQEDITVVPKEMLKKIQDDTQSARKSITLLSRENADQIAVDRYRTAAVEGEPLSVLLVEVDGLSSIREKDGDKAAYRVFAGIVKYVFSKVDRESDVLGRYGQNGFSVLLPRVDMNAAEKFAESIREYADGASFKTPVGQRRATLSIGVAAITDETGNYDSMVKRADMALFVAKKNGRNCVKVRL
ncbi:MAG: GGDEF domain-containing protein [Gammaproteobacteria bacterium]|nr:GGDEF domain-containing protein [Gammaproteobacteria bacterium]